MSEVKTEANVERPTYSFERAKEMVLDPSTPLAIARGIIHGMVRLRGEEHRNQNIATAEFLMRVGDETNPLPSSAGLRDDARCILVRHFTKLRPHVIYELDRPLVEFFTRHPHHCGCLSERDLKSLQAFIVRLQLEKGVFLGVDHSTASRMYTYANKFNVLRGQKMVCAAYTLFEFLRTESLHQHLPDLTWPGWQSDLLCSKYNVFDERAVAEYVKHEQQTCGEGQRAAALQQLDNDLRNMRYVCGSELLASDGDNVLQDGAARTLLELCAMLEDVVYSTRNGEFYEDEELDPTPNSAGAP